MEPSQISLILIITIIIFFIVFYKSDKFTNKENLDNLEIYDTLGVDQPVYSKKCCGNTFSVVPGANSLDPNLNRTYFASNITHLGDGNTEEGCRCLTLKEINYLNSRGGNNYNFNNTSAY